MERVRYISACIFGLLVLILPTVSFGGAWVLAPQEYDLQLFSQFFWNDEDFDTSRNRVRKPNDGRFYEIREELNLELGIPTPPPGPRILRNFNLLFALPVEIAHFEDDNVSLRTTGVEEIRITVKYCLTCEKDVFPVIISGQLTGQFPLCSENDQPPLADCQTDIEGRLLVSQGWPRFYANVEAGYRYRTEEPADEIPYVFEIGYYPWRRGRTRLSLKGSLEGVESRPFGNRGEEEDFIKWSASGRLEIGDLIKKTDPTRLRKTLGAEIGYGSVFAGKNTGAGQIVFLKVFYQH